MGYQFVLDKDPLDCGVLFKSIYHSFESGLTVLVGCNGAGKSTMLHLIKYELDQKRIPYVKYDNVNDGNKSQIGRILSGSYSGCIEDIASLVVSSEGEKIQQNMVLALRSNGILERKIEEAKSSDDRKKLFILADSVDSGASIDNIMEIKSFFNRLVNDLKEKYDIDVFVIASANSYEMASGESCYDVSSCKYHRFKTYTAYKNFILKSRVFKDKRYAKCDAEQAKEEEKKQQKEMKEQNESGNREHFRLSEKWGSK